MTVVSSNARFLSPMPRDPAAVRSVLTSIATGMLSAASTVALAINSFFPAEFSTSRLLVVLAALLALHALCFPRLLGSREVILYAAFVVYMALELFWTADVTLALNTLFPAVDFVLTVLLFGSIFAFHDVRAATIGTVAGCIAAAATFSYATGFPLVYPPDFSYNAVAAVYLFGLFAALVLGLVTRSRAIALLLALMFFVLIGASTSIKTNLGVVLGAAAAVTLHFGQFLRTVVRNLLQVIIALIAVFYVVASNDAVVARVQEGIDRVSLGLEVLRTREDAAGYSGFGERQDWAREGLRGWAANPVFGHGVEAFRHDFEYTSHSTPVDLLYNTGLIGFLLFYSVFGSLAVRLFATRISHPRNLHAVVLAALLCHLFIMLSGIVFYSPLLAAFVGISAALLRRSQSGDQGQRDLALGAVGSSLPDSTI